MERSPVTRPSLVEVARRALARPSGAQLLVDGLSPSGGSETGRVGTEGVELVDRHGTPLLLCEPGAPLADAARRGRCATLTLAGRDGRHRVLFRGQLLPSGRDLVEDREVELIELRLTRVLVRPHAAEGPHDAVDTPVPLADYHGGHDTALASYAASVLAHTNADHPAELREYAARLAGVGAEAAGEPPVHDLVAGAWLRTLDATGTDVAWVDLHGAHTVRVLFPRPARSCAELADLLQCTLCGHA